MRLEKSRLRTVPSLPELCEQVVYASLDETGLDGWWEERRRGKKRKN